MRCIEATIVASELPAGAPLKAQKCFPSATPDDQGRDGASSAGTDEVQDACLTVASVAAAGGVGVDPRLLARAESLPATARAGSTSAGPAAWPSAGASCDPFDQVEDESARACESDGVVTTSWEPFDLLVDEESARA